MSVTYVPAGARPATAVDRPSVSAARTRRIAALDVVRGLAVVGMLLVNNTGDRGATPAELVHSTWHGLTVADLVFPLFLFAVGVAMPLSRTSGSWRKALRRTALLFAIGGVLVMAKHRSAVPSATGVLQHIGGAYLLCWLLLRLPRRWQPVVAIGVLGAVWASYELAGGSYGVTDSVASRLDAALLGTFSAEGPHNLPTSMVSVWLGVVAGRVFARHRDEERRMAGLLVLATALMASGVVVASAGVPVNKALWTPSYVLVTSGIGVATLAAAYQLVDRLGMVRMTRPLLVLGANAIVVYVATSLAAAALSDATSAIVSPVQRAVGAPIAAVGYALCFVVGAWALAEWLFRRRLFIRI